jgi:hypothetical protein
MKIEFYETEQAVVVLGEYPPASSWQAQIAHRDEVARAIAQHPSNGFQYGVDISAGNVDCVHVVPVDGKFPLIVQPNENGDLPDNAVPATICVYDSWR